MAEEFFVTYMGRYFWRNIHTVHVDIYIHSVVKQIQGANAIIFQDGII